VRAPVIEVADPLTGEIVSMPGLPALPGATPLGLELPPSLSWDQWSAYGATLQVAHKSIMYLLGDWLRYGAWRFGERYTQAVAATGRDVQTLMNAAWVCGRIPPSRRRDALSFSHHAEVAALEPDQQDGLLDWCVENRASRSELRAEIEHRGLRQPRKAPLDAPSPDVEEWEATGSPTLTDELAGWLADGRELAARVRKGVPFAVASGEQDSFDELVELIQVLDRAAGADARRAAA
jgi:hypothetical protein